MLLFTLTISLQCKHQTTIDKHLCDKMHEFQFASLHVTQGSGNVQMKCNKNFAMHTYLLNHIQQSQISHLQSIRFI